VLLSLWKTTWEFRILVLRGLLSRFAAKLGAYWIGTDTNLVILFDFGFLDYLWGFWMVGCCCMDDRNSCSDVAGGVLEIG
jgi:hypothetical protein